MKIMSWLLVTALSLTAPAACRAAIGCTLSSPARDLKALYPAMTSYREDVFEFHRMPDGESSYGGLKDRLGGDLDPVYESINTPFTVYRVFRGGDLIGIVHGVNVAGQDGVIQLFLSANPETAVIERVFYQRLESLGSRALRQASFLGQFAGLTLADFYRHDYFRMARPGDASDRIAAVKPPEGLPADAERDYAATLRGLRKNLILLDIFMFNRRFEPWFERAREALRAPSSPSPPAGPANNPETPNA